MIASYKILLLTALIAFLALFRVENCFAFESIAIIVNKSNPTSDISLAELAAILKGKKMKWGDGQNIVKINMEAETDERRDLYRSTLNLEPHSKITLPSSDEHYDGIIARNEEAMVALVAATTNSIGYVYSSAANDKVKVLRINGYLPRDPGYTLKHVSF